MLWSTTSEAVVINMKKDFPKVKAAVRINPIKLLVRNGNEKFQENNPIMADSTLFKIFDFPRFYGNKKQLLSNQ